MLLQSPIGDLSRFGQAWITPVMSEGGTPNHLQDEMLKLAVSPTAEH